MRNIQGIIIHCTATRPKWRIYTSTADKVEEVRRWHVEDNGWSDIGYHFLIDRDGSVAPGRPVHRQGAHVRGHNDGTIGVSLFGAHGAEATDKFEDHFTDAQNAALRELISTLKAQYGDLEVTGHNDYANKGCPGFQVAEWLDEAPISHPDPAEQPQGLVAALVAALLSIFRGKK